MQKRIAFKLALAGAMALMLSACGDKTEAPQPAKKAGPASMTSLVRNLRRNSATRSR